MDRVFAVAPALVLAAACSLTTSFDGLSTGGPAPADAGGSMDGTAPPNPDGGDEGGAAASYRALVVADQPVAYYRLADASGPVAKDEMGRFDATYVGELEHGAAGPLSTSGGATRFLGAGRVVADALVRQHSWTALSVELWASAAVASDEMFLATVANSAGKDVLAILLQASPRLYVVRANESSTKSTSPIDGSSWHHVAFTLASGQLSVYVDGALEATRAVTPADMGEGFFTIGSDLDSESGAPVPNEYFTGALAEVAVYDRVLPPERIAAHHAARVATRRGRPDGDAMGRALASSSPSGSDLASAGVLGEGMPSFVDDVQIVDRAHGARRVHVDRLLRGRRLHLGWAGQRLAGIGRARGV